MGDIRYNKSIVKNINESLIRRVLQNEGSFTKTKIARETGLSFPTVSRILDEMTASGEILSSGVDPTTGGRHAHSYVLNPEFAYVLCLLCRPNGFVSIVINSVGEKVETETFDAELDGDAFVGRLDEIITLKQTQYAIRALSIGLSWGVTSQGVILFGAEPYGLENYPLKEHLEEKFGVRVRIENDMNAIVAGCYERMFPEGSGRALACVSVGRTGCGCGLYLRGHLIRGVNGFAGELRYLPVNSERNLDKEFQEGFTGEPEAVRIAQLVSSVCCVVDPGTIVFYRHGGDEEKLAEVEELCRRYLPEEVCPKLILTDTYEEDYEAGLIAFGRDLLLTGYEIVNRG